jgi:hypothetical protein
MEVAMKGRKSFISLLTLALLMSFSPIAAWAQGGVILELVAQIYGATCAIGVQGYYAYIGVGNQLVVLDVSNPLNPTLIGQTDILPDSVGDVAITGNYAFVANEHGGLRVIDVSNPANPIEVGFYDTPGYAHDVVLAGNYAYVADTWGGLRVIDISNPINPTEVGIYDTPRALGVAVVGNYAYIADYEEGLRIVDVSTPANPIGDRHC